MATAYSRGKGRSRRIQLSKLGAGAPRRWHPTQQNREQPGVPEREPAIRIGGRFRQFLQSEQALLLKAESLLLCITKSMDDCTHPITGPYYPDVVTLAAELVKRRAINIDQLLLDGRLPEVPEP